MRCACHMVGKRVVGLSVFPRLLAGFGRDDCGTILGKAVHRFCAARENIVAEGAPANHFHLITSGKAQMYKGSGLRRIPIRWLKAGLTCGGMSMMPQPSNYMATTEMLTDGCVVTWDGATLCSLTRQFPQLWPNIFRMAGDHVLWLSDRAVSLSSGDDARRRIATFLHAMAGEVGTPTDDGLSIYGNNEELASAVNCDPDTFGRVVKEMEREGLLRKARGRIVIVSPDAMR